MIIQAHLWKVYSHEKIRGGGGGGGRRIKKDLG